MFDAVSIEHAFAQFLEKGIGARGGAHDADVFRGGDHKELGELLEDTAKHFKKRVDRIKFAPEDSQAGKVRARLGVNIDRLAESGATMKKSKGREAEDYHWEIIGVLIGSLAALLDHLESKQPAS